MTRRARSHHPTIDSAAARPRASAVVIRCLVGAIAIALGCGGGSDGDRDSRGANAATNGALHGAPHTEPSSADHGEPASAPHAEPSSADHAAPSSAPHRAPSSAPHAAPSSAAATVASVPTTASPTPAATPQSSHYRGLWVLAEGSQRVLEDAKRTTALVENARRLGATDLFVQVYRGGRSWYDAELADAEPYRKLMEATGQDTFAELLVLAHAAGMRVHAWVNVLSLGQNRDAPLLESLGAGAVHVDRRGRSLLDYPHLEIPEPDASFYQMGTRGIYLDPAAPGVTPRLAAVFTELIARYPNLDGLHLDYIRHPAVLPLIPGSRFRVGLDFGYGEASRKRFNTETGLRAPFDGVAVNADAWDAWRRAKVTELVAVIGQAAESEHPGLLLSAAVIAYSDRAYLTLAQDWRRWLEDGLVDFVVPMAYTRDQRLYRYQLESFGSGPYADRIWAGLGTWLFGREPAKAVQQIEIARDAGVAGDALFSYDSILESAGLFDAIARDVTRGQ